MPRKVHLYTVGKTLTDCTVPPVQSRGLAVSWTVLELDISVLELDISLWCSLDQTHAKKRLKRLAPAWSLPVPLPVPVPVPSACLQNQCPVSYPHIDPRWTRICPRILFTFRPQREPNQTLSSATEPCRHTIQVKPVLRKSV